VNNTKYKKEYCKLLIDHMRVGMSYDSLPAKIYDFDGTYVGISTMYDWEKNIEEWANVKAIALAKSLSFYEQRASAKVSGQKIDGINTKDIDRFHKIYGDKSRLEHDITEEAKGALKLAYNIRD
jgi:hypothetical protein